VLSNIWTVLYNPGTEEGEIIFFLFLEEFAKALMKEVSKDHSHGQFQEELGLDF
jgi:hypothetical protein